MCNSDLITNNSYSSPLTPSAHITTAIADSGATDTLVRSSQQHLLTDVHSPGGLDISLPNKDVITSIARGSLPVTGSINPSILAHVIDDQ